MGQRIYLYGPWQQFWNLGVVKKTKIGEKKDIEFRASFQNAFNSANFLLRRRRQRCEHAECRGDGHAAIWTNPQPYRDFTVSSTNDPGGRVIEFTLRFNF